MFPKTNVKGFGSPRFQLNALALRLRFKDGGDGGGGGGSSEEALRQEIIELRRENANFRVRAREAEAARDDAKNQISGLEARLREADAGVQAKIAEAVRGKDAEIQTLKTSHETALAAAKQEGEAAVAAKEQEYNTRLLHAEIKSQVAAKGVVNGDDFLKLADLSKVALKDGKLDGLDAVIEAEKTARPYLFSTSAGSTSSTKQAPAGGTGGPVDAKQMTKEQYAAAKAAFNA